MNPVTVQSVPSNATRSVASDSASVKAMAASHSNGGLPDFVCIGAQRCGTTTLWAHLRQHPQIFLPDRKELHFFDDRYGHWQQGMTWYRRFFEDAPVGTRRGEVSPSYLFVPEACARMHEAIPNARLLVILRDPVRRAWSQYWYNVRHGRETRSFDQAIQDDVTLEHAGLDHLWGDASYVLERGRRAYVRRGYYHEQIMRYAERFGAEALFVTTLEELKADPKSIMREVWSHLDVDADQSCMSASAEEHNTAVHPRHWSCYRRAVGIARWSASRGTVCRAVARRISGLDRRFNRRPGLPPMPESSKAYLRDVLAPHDEKLAAWWRRPLPWTLAPTDRGDMVVDGGDR